MHYKNKKEVLQMDKKRMILASLASAAVLGAGFTATQQAVVKADDSIKTNSEQAAEAKKAAEAKVAELEKKAAEAKSKQQKQRQH